MSTTIDQRVVEMRFDNKNFENNVSTTISSLDKLKQRLNLTGASKGLEEVNHAAKKVDMSGLGTAIQTVHAKFSALEVVGITALTNITNQAVNAGKRLAAAFTIDPMKTGFNEYELKMGSIQTIMSSTGESLETVNKYLNELNEYSDKTIYSFSDMTQNIGKFTNAGVKLEDAVLAIKGISNEAAVSGANANEASRAMYNFAQALSAGYVKLIDWKSVENANMATVEFKNQLIEAAVAAGTLEKSSDGMYRVLTTNTQGSTFDQTISATKFFNDSLNYQWMTTEVLVNTLKDYADETTDIGKKAFSAAQDVKTFSMMMDTLKESAQSGWAATWEILFGDLEEAKKLWTGLTNFFGKFIDKMSDARNSFLRSALGERFDNLTGKIKQAGLSTEDFEKALAKVAGDNGKDLNELIGRYGSLIKVLKSGEISTDMISKALKILLGVEGDVAKTTEDLGNIVNRVINLEFGVGEERVKKLTEAGYNYAQVQNLVNEKLGSSFRHHVELSDAQLKQADSLSKLSDEQLKSKGYTEEQIAALRDLQKIADESGETISELIENLEKQTGRELIIESFKNIAEAIGEIVKIAGEAWTTIFGDSKLFESDDLYGAIDFFHSLTESMKISEDAAKNFKSIFEGLFAILQIGNMMFTVTLKSGIKILADVLKLFDMNLLDLAGMIGECIVKVYEWIKANTIFLGHIGKIAEIISILIRGVRDWIDAFAGLKVVKDTIEKLKKLFKDLFDTFNLDFKGFGFGSIVDYIEQIVNNITTAIKNLDSNAAFQAGANIVYGIIEGIATTAFKAIQAIIQVGLDLISGFCDTIDSHSPSRVFMAIGGFIIAGLILGLQNGSSELLTKAVELVKGFISSVLTAIPEGFTNIKKALEENGGNALGAIKTVFGKFGDFLVEHVGGLFAKIIDRLSQIDLGGVVALVLGAGIILTISKMLKIIENLTKPLMSFSKVLGSAKGVLDAIQDKIKGDKLANAARSIFVIASAIGVLALSLFLVASIPQGKLLPALGAIAAVTVAVLAIAALAGKIGDVSITGNLGKLSLALLTLSGSLILMAATMKILGSISSSDMDRVMKGFLGMIVGVVAIIFTLSRLNSAWNDQIISKVGWTFIKLSVALLLMTTVMKRIAKMSAIDIVKGLGTIAVLELFFIGMAAACKVAQGGGFGDAGGMMLKTALALMVMLLVFKLAGKLKANEIINGVVVMVPFGLLLAAMAHLARKAGPNIGQIGIMAIGVSAALILIAKACKLAGELTVGGLVKGLIAVGVLGALMYALIKVTKGAGKHFIKVGFSLILMSAALTILVGLLYIAKELEWAEIGKSLVVVGLLAVLFSGLIAATHKAKDVAKNIMWMTITIGILAAALIALSFIPKEDLYPAARAIMGVIAVFAALVGITKIAKSSKDFWKTLVPLVAAATILGVLIYALAKLPNPDAALTASKGLSLVILSFAGVIAILSKVKATIKNVKFKSVLLPMIAVVGALALILGLLASFTTKPESLIPSAIALGVLVNALAVSLRILDKVGAISSGTLVAAGVISAVMLLLATSLKILDGMDPKSAIGNAVALSALLLAVSGCLFILSKMNLATNFTDVLAGIFGLVLMAAPMMAFVAILQWMDGIQNATENVKALVTLMSVVTLLLVPLSIIGAIAMSGVGAGFIIAGILALTAMAIPMVAFVAILQWMDGIQNAAGNVVLLIGLMTIMTDLLTRLAIIGPMAVIGVSALTGLTGLMIGLGILAVAIGALVDEFPSLKKFLDTGLPILEQIAESIGNMVGKFISAVGESVGDTLTQLGEDIKALMSALAEASTSASKIKEGSFDGVKDLIGVMGDIALMTVGTTFDDIFTLGGTSMEKFQKDGVAFFNAMKAIGKASSEVELNSEAVEYVIETAGKLADLQHSLEPIGGVVDWFEGRDDLGRFGINVASFILSMKVAYGSLEGYTFNTEAMGAIIDASTKLSDLQHSLEPIGGVITWFNGRDDLGEFGWNIESFVSAMKTAYGSLDGCDFNVGAMESIIEASSKLADLQHSLEPIGGVITWFEGRDDLGRFGINVASFILSMKVAYGSLEGYTFNTEAMGAIIDASTKLSDLQHSLEPIGGVITWFNGRDDLGEFGWNIESFVSAMKIAYGSLDDTSLNTEAMSMIIDAATSLADLQHSLEPIGGVITWFNGRDDLGEFGWNVASFITSMKIAFGVLDECDFNTEAMDTIVAAATSLADLQHSLEPIGGVISWFTAKDDLDTFGINAASFVSSMKNAFGTLDGCEFNTGAIDSIVAAATSLAGLQSTLTPVGGVIDWFAGRDDLGTFGTNIALFAAGIGKLKEGMGEDGISQAVIDSVKNAGTALIELEKALPSDGWFDGKMDLSQFSGYINAFATAMSNFATKATEIDGVALGTTISAAYRIKGLIESLVGLDTSGIVAFTGVGAGGFGADGAAYRIAKVMSAYSTEVSGLDIASVETSVSAATTLKGLIANLVGLDTSGIENFKISTIATRMKEYADKISNINVLAVTTSVESAVKLKNLIMELVGLDNSGVPLFGSIISIGSAVRSYATSVSEIDFESVGNSVLNTRGLITLIRDMVGLDTSGVAAFQSAISSLATTDLTGFANAFKDTERFTEIGASIVNAIANGITYNGTVLTTAGGSLVDNFLMGILSRNISVTITMNTILNNLIQLINNKRETFRTLGIQLITNMILGISSRSVAVQLAVTSIVLLAASTIRNGYSSFYNAGSYLVEGFTAGISENSFKAVAASAAMASAAYTSAKEALNINSPSKLFRSLGYSVPEGFAMGIDRLAYMAKNSAVSMADTAFNSVKDSISKIAEAVHTDIDSQPTIRPVLDLSNVESGASVLNGLFNEQASIGVLANAGVISTMMHNKNQNGANDDVIMAIDKLRNKLDSVGNTYYTIDGITYSNGTEVADAITSLTRAIKMEGRV